MMYQFICSIFIVLAIGAKTHCNGARIEWIPLNSGDGIPTNAVLIPYSEDKYVGRARYFDELLLAEIDENGTAKVTSCDKEISLTQYEILTVNGTCEWMDFYNADYSGVSENIVRGVSRDDGVPIYIGMRRSSGGEPHLLSIFLSQRYIIPWPFQELGWNTEQRYLSCKSSNIWINTYSVTIPNNTVSGGISDDGHQIFVARLKKGCEIVTGYVIPEIGAAIGFLNNGERIQSEYCQVLVGEPDEYIWKECYDGEIPDNAVVHGKSSEEPAYIARWNSTIGHLSQPEAAKIKDYDILVKNEVY